jgi:uncharacterized protein with FMN-binding domain
MRRALLTFVTAAVIALPVANATAAATKAKVVIRKFTGATYEADRYRSLQVVITVKKTTIGKKVTRKITAVSVPVYPDHSGRSLYISENAIPILRSEALGAQSANIDLISGATYTSEAFTSSLQSAILKARKA